MRQTSTVAGRLAHRGPLRVVAGDDGTVTGLPAHGTVKRLGSVLYFVDDHPVVVLRGRVPMYRALFEGVDGGRDVRQLEQSLTTLGLADASTLTVDTQWTPATTRAVQRLQQRLAVDQTGRLEVGQAVFTPYEAVRVSASIVALGARVVPGTEVLEVASTEAVAVAEVAADSSILADVGDRVMVRGSRGDEVRGRISDIEPVVPDPAQKVDEERLELSVTLDRQGSVTELSNASVTIELTFLTREDVLAIPVTALKARSDGSYEVDLVDGGGVRPAQVKIGMVANGEVEVVSGIDEGQVVVVAV